MKTVIKDKLFSSNIDGTFNVILLSLGVNLFAINMAGIAENCKTKLNYFCKINHLMVSTG